MMTKRKARCSSGASELLRCLIDLTPLHLACRLDVQAASNECANAHSENKKKALLFMLA